MSKQQEIEERVLEVAAYVIENNATVRTTAKHFGVSKSTIHKDITVRLLEISSQLYYEANKVLQTNKDERHIRGGNVTKERHLKMKQVI